MQISHDFGISIEIYMLRGKNNYFPHFSSCPICKIKKKLYRHGFYYRYGIYKGNCLVRMVLCRYICQNPACKITFSVLPSFLVPRFQFSLDSILSLVKGKLDGVKLLEGIRQRADFYYKRFISDSHQNWILQFFRNEGITESVSEEKIKKAKKLLNMIQDFGESTFLRKSTESFSNYFMAPSLYQIKKIHST